MTEPLCLKCGHGIDAHGSFGCLDCSHESICVEQASAIYRQALAEAQADSARLTAELQTAISVKIANAKSADAWQKKYESEDKLCQIIAGHRDDYKRERDALREAVEAYALDPDAATHFLNINPERDEPFADALLRWHASRQPDPAPGGTENG
jgi:hypothetical protein